MKIRFWDRLVLFFGGLLTILSGAALVLFSLPVLALAGEQLTSWMRIAACAAGALEILLGVFLLAFPRRYRRGRHDFVVQQTENGELRIAIQAIESLVQKCIDMHEEIHVVSMHIRNKREGVVIDLRISLANNISIPLAVASLQKQIKQYLVASSGIEVQEVRVSVETAQDAAGSSPYLVHAEENGEKQPEQKETREAKLPLHRRIFGRDVHPATEPPAPAAQEAPETETEEAASAAEETPAQEQVSESSEDAMEEIVQDAETEESLKEDADDE